MFAVRVSLNLLIDDIHSSVIFARVVACALNATEQVCEEPSCRERIYNLISACTPSRRYAHQTSNYLKIQNSRSDAVVLFLVLALARPPATDHTSLASWLGLGRHIFQFFYIQKIPGCPAGLNHYSISLACLCSERLTHTQARLNFYISLEFAFLFCTCSCTQELVCWKQPSLQITVFHSI